MTHPIGQLVRADPRSLRPVRSTPGLEVPGVVVARIWRLSFPHGPAPARPEWSFGNERILCDEHGHLFVWHGEHLRPLPSHALGPLCGEAPSPAIRPWFQEPGHPVVVRFNDVRSLLEPQLAHPERLRDNHRVAALAQIYEVTKPLSLPDVAARVLGDRSRAGELAVATDALLSVIGFGHATGRGSGRLEVRHDHARLRRHERILRLTVARDPSSEAPVADPGRTDAHEPAHRDNQRSIKKDAVPDGYAKPWEFRLTREEACHDVARRRNSGIVRRLCRRLVLSALSRSEHRRWTAVRSGKSLDEQLWGVRPPRARLDDPGVREWVRETLARAGYDSEAMLVEWEIFWTRRIG